MHGDFKYNLIRFNLLKEGKKNNLKLENLEDFFQNKELGNISKEEIKAQLEHLTMEDFLSKVSDDEYKVTDKGKIEIEEVEKAIEKL